MYYNLPRASALREFLRRCNSKTQPSLPCWKNAQGHSLLQLAIRPVISPSFFQLFPNVKYMCVFPIMIHESDNLFQMAWKGESFKISKINVSEKRGMVCVYDAAPKCSCWWCIYSATAGSQERISPLVVVEKKKNNKTIIITITQ